YALGKLGQDAAPAVPTLTDMLKGGDDTLRKSAATALGMIGPEARDSVTCLREAIEDTHPVVRIRAAEALWKVDGQLDVPITVLTQLWDDNEYGWMAAEALGNIGPGARAAVPQLLQALNGDPSTGRSAGRALKKIDPEAAGKAGVE